MPTGRAILDCLQDMSTAGISLKGSVTPKKERSIVFVLGGPGSGKGTQVLKHSMQIPKSMGDGPVPKLIG